MRFIADVARQQDGTASRLLYPPRRFPSIAAFVQIGDGYARSLTRECDSDGTADARVSTRDQRNFAIPCRDKSARRGRAAASSPMTARAAVGFAVEKAA